MSIAHDFLGQDTQVFEAHGTRSSTRVMSSKSLQNLCKLSNRPWWISREAIKLIPIDYVDHSFKLKIDLHTLYRIIKYVIDLIDNNRHLFYIFSNQVTSILPLIHSFFLTIYYFTSRAVKWITQIPLFSFHIMMARRLNQLRKSTLSTRT